MQSLKSYKWKRFLLYHTEAETYDFGSPEKQTQDEIKHTRISLGQLAVRGSGEGAWEGWENHQTVLKVWPHLQERVREG